MKRTLLAMALLLTSVFGVTGCGSDDDVAVESRVKNAAPGLDASDAPSQADCQSLFIDFAEDLGAIELLEKMSDEFDFLDILNLLDRLDDRDFLDSLELLQTVFDFEMTIDILDALNLIDDLVIDRDRWRLCADLLADWKDSVTTSTVPYVDEVPPCVEGREVENSEECLP